MLYHVYMMHYSLYIMRKTSHGVIVMQPIAARKTTKELVYDQIKNGILNGTIGRQEILTETKLANALNTSRTPIREAVADLTNEGLLVHIPQKGFQVRKITESELEQIFYLRTSIEMKGIAVLTKNCTEQQIKELRQIISRQETAIGENDRITYIELDQLFHRNILQFAKLNLLEQIFKDLYNLSLLIGHTAITKAGRMEEVIWEHKSIVDALEDKNVDLATKMVKSHLESSGKSVKIQFHHLNETEK